MKKILALKHWQLFVLLVGVPAVLVIPMIIVAIKMEDVSKVFLLNSIMIITACTLVFCWLYSLGTNLHKRLPADVNMNISLFKTCLVFPTVYFIALGALMFNLFEHLSLIKSSGVAIWFFLVFPLHLVSILCYFYCFYFIAKALKAVELQRPVTFGDFIGEFFLVWYYPIGLWFIQPRVNKIMQD